MYQMNAGRAEAGLEDREDLRHGDAEGFGLVVDDVVDDVGEEPGTLVVQVLKTLVRAGSWLALNTGAQGRGRVLGRAPREVL